MRLGRKVKFNMIIAILLCMAFVVNIGSTLAAATYSFLAKSSVDATTNETYIEYASAEGTSGKYTYSVGSYNNQLSINYGFSGSYDLMVEFTAQYSNPDHHAKDFSLNFVNRDMWCIDMLTVESPTLKNQQGDSYKNTFYALTSNTYTISGVMYYMKALSDSGCLPIISGVTFYTSLDNSKQYIGDELTVTLTPRYVKSGTYSVDTHAFKDNLLTAGKTEAFSNWITYMNKDNTSLSNPIVMAYNAYANSDFALKYPTDYDWSTKDDKGNYNFNLAAQSEGLYSNTAYKYSVTYDPELKTDGSNEYEYNVNRSFSSLIAGNKYYGGTGLYIIPGKDINNPVHITVGYGWYKNNSTDNVQTDMVRIIEDDNWSDDITIIGTGHYSRMAISKPVYIDVLDYIMMTAEDPYLTILRQGYGLVITSITATQVSAPANWENSDKENYKVLNSTEQSPSLVRIKDVSGSTKTLDVNVDVANNSDANMAITGLTVKAKLWYSAYVSDTDNEGNTIVSEWSEKLVNTQDGAHLPLLRLETDLVDYFGYDKDMWNVTSLAIDTDNDEGITKPDGDTTAYKDTMQFTFSSKNGAYISKGYALDIIDSIMIPMQYYPTKGENFVPTGGKDIYENPLYTPITVYDMWCTLEVTNVSTSSSISYNATSAYSGVETTTNGYYSFVASGNSTQIYLKNNTSQDITSVTLDELTLGTPDGALDAGLIDREKIKTSQNLQFKVDYMDGTSLTYNTNPIGNQTGFSAKQCSVVVRPNEKVLVCTVTDIADAQHSYYIIKNYNVKVNFKSGAETSALDLIKNDYTGTIDLINNSSKYYEFRVVSSADVSSKLINYSSDKSITDFFVTNYGGQYYYHYKGVICPHQHIKMVNDLTTLCDVSIQFVEHVANGYSNYYKAENYGSWNTNSELSSDWLTAMENIYAAPSEATN